MWLYHGTFKYHLILKMVYHWNQDQIYIYFYNIYNIFVLIYETDFLYKI